MSQRFSNDPDRSAGPSEGAVEGQMRPTMQTRSMLLSSRTNEELKATLNRKNTMDQQQGGGPSGGQPTRRGPPTSSTLRAPSPNGTNPRDRAVTHSGGPPPNRGPGSMQPQQPGSPMQPHHPGGPMQPHHPGGSMQPQHPGGSPPVRRMKPASGILNGAANGTRSGSFLGANGGLPGAPGQPHPQQRPVSMMGPPTGGIGGPGSRMPAPVKRALPAAQQPVAVQSPKGETFPIRLRLAADQQYIVRCSPGTSLGQFLQYSLAKLSDFIDPQWKLDELLVKSEDGVEIAMDSVIADTPYIQRCRAETVIPVLALEHCAKAASSTSSVHIQNALQEADRLVHNPSPPPQPAAVVEPELIPAVSYPKAEDHPVVVRAARANSQRFNMVQLAEFPVQFLLPGGQTVVMQCIADVTISTIKNQLHEYALDKKIHLRPMTHYVLKTPEGYISDETTSLGSIGFVEQCREQSTTPKIILIEKSEGVTKKEKFINLEIGSLIGRPLSWTQDDSESTQFRKSMEWVRFQEKKLRSGKDYGHSDVQMNVSSKPLENIPKKLLVKLRLKLLEGSLEKTVLVGEGETANQFKENMFNKYYEKRAGDKTAADFILKVPGLAEYLDGNNELTSFECIRDFIAKGQQPQLSLVEREFVDNSMYVEEFPDEEFLEDPKLLYNHEEIKSELLPWDQMNRISVWEMNKPFRVKIVGCENMRKQQVENENVQIYVTAGLYHGGELVSPLMTSQSSNWNQNPRWYDWLSTNISMSNIPRATRICFTVYARPTKKDELSNRDIPLGWVACQLFDYKHELRTGLMGLSLWLDDKANPIGTCVANINNPSPCTLFIEFETYALPVVFPTEPIPQSDFPRDYVGMASRKPTQSSKANKLIGVQSDNIAYVNNLISKDPLWTITANDKKILWEEREYCKTKAHSLPKFLLSVAYNDRLAVQVMQSMLRDWPSIKPVDALELLDSKFADEKVRNYAVNCLEQVMDDQLMDYLLQLVQALKYEPYHDSALARFLLRRSLANRRIGHSFFWYLKSEIHVAEITERFGLLLEAYLRGCGSHRLELKKQTGMLKEMTRIANVIKPMKDTDRREALQSELKKTSFPKLQLPLNPSIEVSGLEGEKCKYMDSKKLPLWLKFSNSDQGGEGKYVIFKAGDDLRQDMLTLQMIRLMDKLWKGEGMDLELSPYGCIATGNEEGMIEVVLNSDTCANITKNAGGATAAFRVDPLANWLRSHNSSDEAYAEAVNKFILSCAGYCVASYVLGIGDRHNDNVMVTRDGRLFHIDFGHFLGNYKKKFGFKRERAPFVFTPDFAYVMGGRDSKDFMQFVDLCCNAYNILRKHANVFINLFAMMLSTGIPELQSLDDLLYLREAFSLDATDEQARVKFKALIYESLATKTTQFNNAIHILAH